jgi:hypothetical protein
MSRPHGIQAAGYYLEILPIEGLRGERPGIGFSGPTNPTKPLKTQRIRPSAVLSTYAHNIYYVKLSIRTHSCPQPLVALSLSRFTDRHALPHLSNALRQPVSEESAAPVSMARATYAVIAAALVDGCCGLVEVVLPQRIVPCPLTTWDCVAPLLTSTGPRWFGPGTQHRCPALRLTATDPRQWPGDPPPERCRR